MNSNTVFRYGVAVLILAIGTWLSVGSPDPVDKPVAHDAGLLATSVKASMELPAFQPGTPIEQIRVGMRVAARNPEVSDGERATFVEPDAATWRLLKLSMEKADGGVLEIDMIRPEEWVRSIGAFQGADVKLEMPELGAEGVARVLYIGPCPSIEDGPGQIVISTFAHPASHQILDVTFDSVTLHPSSSIGVTATHPFWSEDRQAFVPIGQMQIGERVRTLSGEMLRMATILPRPGPPERVYNLEVLGEHTYFVGQQQLLVHNEYIEVFRLVDMTELDDIIRRGNRYFDPGRKKSEKEKGTQLFSGKEQEMSCVPFFLSSRNELRPLFPVLLSQVIENFSRYLVYTHAGGPKNHS